MALQRCRGSHRGEKYGDLLFCVPNAKAMGAFKMMVDNCQQGGHWDWAEYRPEGGTEHLWVTLRTNVDLENVGR